MRRSAGVAAAAASAVAHGDDSGAVAFRGSGAAGGEQHCRPRNRWAGERMCTRTHTRVKTYVRARAHTSCTESPKVAVISAKTSASS